jgi:hypothetical protein
MNMVAEVSEDINKAKAFETAEDTESFKKSCEYDLKGFEIVEIEG